MIRPATPQDLNPIYHLICELEHHSLDKPYFEQTFTRYLADPLKHILVALQADRIVGLITLRIEHQLHHTHPVAEILELVVDPSLHRAGIGQQLINQAFHLARQNHCALIEVACNQTRTQSHLFYQKMGLHNTHFKFTQDL